MVAGQCNFTLACNSLVPHDFQDFGKRGEEVHRVLVPERSFVTIGIRSVRPWSADEDNCSAGPIHSGPVDAPDVRGCGNFYGCERGCLRLWGRVGVVEQADRLIR